MPVRVAPLTALVLAAGQGTRMRSRTIKLLHSVAGRPMVAWVLEAVRALRPARAIAVVGFQADAMRDALGDLNVAFVVQKEQRGTGHAVVQAKREIAGVPRSTLLILAGDLPTLRPQTLRDLVARHRRAGAAFTVLTAEVENPRGYGRIVRDGRSQLARIVEERDASPPERAIREINTGIYCADSAKLLRVLAGLRPDNAQGEYYLTDAVQRLIRRGERVLATRHADSEEVLGVNTRAELARATRTLYARKAHDLLDGGVTLIDPSCTWIDPRARIGRDSVIYPNVIIEGPTIVGEGSVILQGCRLTDCRIGANAEIRDHSVLAGSEIGDGASVGPFAHLRPGSVLAEDARVGNFVELKKTTLGPRSKASHLSYLGDATIGGDCNIGAGTITCNYDGTRKHRTILGEGVFIGSDTQLIAPVTVEDGAYVAAGTTVTEDVPPAALAIGRSRQRNIEGWVTRKQAAAARKPKRKR